MATDQKEASQKLRDSTDKRLVEERLNTDAHLARNTQAVTKEAEEEICRDRLAADQEREIARAEVDLDKTKNRLEGSGARSSQADDKSLTLERACADEARDLEREREDRVRAKERFHKRLISEALLENERKDTDTNLVDERALIDLESERNSSLLLGEEISHELTRNALVTRDQYLAVVSHDLKNPLGSISMAAALLRRDLSKGAPATDRLLKYLEIIERNAANMERMICDLLDVERMAHAQLVVKTQRADLCALLQECMALFAPVVASKSFSMTVSEFQEPVFADLDRDRILQVLSNLIGNALKFTPKGGAIKLSAQKKDSEVETSVSDNGPGIPEEMKSKIFERFSQLRANDRRGLGLGLFIAKWIIEAHRGRIWVVSEVGKGSTFTFTIPVSARC